MPARSVVVVTRNRMRSRVFSRISRRCLEAGDEIAVTTTPRRMARLRERFPAVKLMHSRPTRRPGRAQHDQHGGGSWYSLDDDVRVEDPLFLAKIRGLSARMNWRPPLRTWTRRPHRALRNPPGGESLQMVAVKPAISRRRMRHPAKRLPIRRRHSRRSLIRLRGAGFSYRAVLAA